MRRVVRDLAWHELHKTKSLVSPSVQEIKADAMAELDDLVEGLGSLALESRPPVDSTRPEILTSPSRPDSERLTLNNLDA